MTANTGVQCLLLHLQCTVCYRASTLKALPGSKKNQKRESREGKFCAEKLNFYSTRGTAEPKNLHDRNHFGIE